MSQTRKTFLRNVLVGFGVGAKTIKVSELQPPKDDLVEELTKRVQEYEAKLAGKDQVIQALTRPAFTSGYYMTSSIGCSYAFNPTKPRDM